MSRQTLSFSKTERQMTFEKPKHKSESGYNGSAKKEKKKSLLPYICQLSVVSIEFADLRTSTASMGTVSLLIDMFVGKLVCKTLSRSEPRRRMKTPRLFLDPRRLNMNQQILGAHSSASRHTNEGCRER